MVEVQASPARLAPPGYIALADYARQHGIRPTYAAQCARAGRVPGAVQVRPVGAPKPIWVVPVGCTWRPRRYTRCQDEGSEG